MSDDNAPLHFPPTRARIARELDDELRLHYELRVEAAMQAGMSEADAHREATRRLGDVDQWRAECLVDDHTRVRRVRLQYWRDELRQDLRFAVRQLQRQRSFTAAALVTLACGIALALVSFAVIHRYLLQPLPYPDADRLAYVIHGPSREPFPNAPSLRGVNWLPVDSVFDGVVSWDLDGFTLTGHESPEFVDGAWVTAGYFRHLGFQPALGRLFTADEFAAAAPVAIISEALWARRFNRDPNIVGQSIRAFSTDRPASSELVTVVGVLPADAWHISSFTDILRPLEAGRAPSIVRLPEGASLVDAERVLNTIVRSQLGAVDVRWRMSLVRLQDEYTYSIRPLLVTAFGASVFMLLIAAASVAGAMTARATSRQRELQLRAALGASRARIVRQLLTESGLLALLAIMGSFVLAVATIHLLQPALQQVLGVAVPSSDGSVMPPPGMIVAITIAALAIVVMFNLAPALIVSRSSSRRGQAGDRITGSVSTAPTMRRLLVTGQVALTVLLLLGAGLMTRTVRTLESTPLGFDDTGVLKGELLLPRTHFPDSASRAAVVSRVLEELRSVPGVASATAASPHPFRGMAQTPVRPEELPDPTMASQASLFTVEADFFDVLDVPLVAGRRFTKRDNSESELVVVISEGLAREWWGEANPVGRRLRIGDGPLRTVVGLARDIRSPRLAAQLPDILVPFDQSPRPFLSILVRFSRGTSAQPELLRTAVARVNGDLAVAAMEPLSQVVSRDGARPRMMAGILAALSVVALALAALGIYSSLAYLVALRSREMALRLAVGATGNRVALLVLREGLGMALLGVCAGATAGLAFRQFIAAQIVGISPHDPITLVTVAVVVVGSAIAAGLIPALRAARIDPGITLRTD